MPRAWPGLDDHGYPAEMTASVQAMAVDWLTENVAWLWNNTMCPEKVRVCGHRLTQ